MPGLRRCAAQGAGRHGGAVRAGDDADHRRRCSPSRVAAHLRLSCASAPSPQGGDPAARRRHRAGGACANTADTRGASATCRCFFACDVFYQAGIYGGDRAGRDLRRRRRCSFETRRDAAADPGGEHHGRGRRLRLRLPAGPHRPHARASRSRMLGWIVDGAAGLARPTTAALFWVAANIAGAVHGRIASRPGGRWWACCRRHRGWRSSSACGAWR
ncbi:MAG: hypothetical protein MZW92_01460 [Comamonadaceae bacterium]|nr:hypothetical protein [Comamonadaceae bacterium]